MPRQSTVRTGHDSAGDYEIEIFDCMDPRRVIVCSHGNGVRRWDGEKFFYAVAEHYVDSAVLLVDQNQQDRDGVRVNPLPILVQRVNQLIAEARQLYPGTSIVLMGHSMGCGVATRVDLSYVDKVVFVTPGAGDQQAAMIERYGQDIAKGKSVTTSDGLKKVITADFFASMKDVVWENEYAKLLKRYSPVYAFEAGSEEIVGEERFTHRELPFTQYKIIPSAKHNLTGEPLADLFAQVDCLL